ncbi:hypothetical protein JCM18382A_09870 [Bradyrhizobium sp. 17-4]
MARILEKREQRQQQQDNNDPEGEIPQIGVHGLPSVVARIAASLYPWAGSVGIPRESIPSMPYNLGAAGVDAKGTTHDYLPHPSAIPGQKMTQNPVFFRGG